MYVIVMTLFSTVVGVFHCNYCETFAECEREAASFIAPAELEGENYCVAGEPPPLGELTAEQEAARQAYIAEQSKR